MAIGEIKSVLTVDGQHVAEVITGSGRKVTATVMQAGFCDFCPIPGDMVLFHELGQEIVVTAVSAKDSEAGPGEQIVFSRTLSGDVIASIHVKADGSVVVTPTTTANIGAGSGFVAMASRVDALFTALASACAAFTPPGAPDGGAALSAVISGALSSINTASTNLKAD